MSANLPEVLEAKLDKALSNLAYVKVILLVNSSLCGLINLYFFSLLIKRKLDREISEFCLNFEYF